MQLKVVEESKMAESRDNELYTLKLERRIADLEGIVKSFTEALKDSSKLLQQITPRPKRISIPLDRRLQIAADQEWSCADPYADGMCPLRGGVFTSAFLPFHIDHEEQWSKVHNNLRLRVICAMCHNRLTRDQRLRDLDERQAESE